MRKYEVVNAIFQQRVPSQPQREKGLAFTPTNIALVKYWGKRDIELNLPVTSSLSISLPEKGAMTTASISNKDHDIVILNNVELAEDSDFVKRVKYFLDLFRQDAHWHLQLDIKMNIPVAAGLASSACGFSSLVSSLKDLFDWKLTLQQLSILARLGSGSAARSLWLGFVEWHRGVQADGMDSFASPIKAEWPELRVGVLCLSNQQKLLSSREAMLRTVNSSLLYKEWPKKTAQDMAIIKKAVQMKNFSLLGGTAESNALTMHATMLGSWPPVCYFLPETIAAMQQVWQLRQQGLDLYFTQDAGPNLKLLFLERDQATIKQHFPQIEIIKVFD